MEPSEREQLLHIYAQSRTIAVVGASADVSKAAHQVPLKNSVAGSPGEVSLPQMACHFPSLPISGFHKVK